MLGSVATSAMCVLSGQVWHSAVVPSEYWSGPQVAQMPSLPRTAAEPELYALTPYWPVRHVT